MLCIGLTGGIGCGKSVVAHMFSDLGTPVIDADSIAHQLVEPGSALLDEIIASFGEQYRQPDGSLDRKRLASAVFEHPEQKARLEAIIHPEVRDSIRRQLEAYQQQDYVIVAIPLLIETGYTGLVDRVLVVDCDEESQLQRVLARDERDEQQVRQIMQQQVSRLERMRHADEVLKNNSDMAALKTQVEHLDDYYRNLSRI
jgi:dephospho-CoA kinase